jgi:6-phosphofructokinase 2
MQPAVTLTMNPALDVTAGTDRIVPGEKLRCSPPRHDPGGGGINVARALCLLGGSATAVFPTGGATGRLLESLLTAEDVPCRTVAITGTTRENFNIDEHRTGQQYRFIMPGPTLEADERQRCLDEAMGLMSFGGYFVASGSLPPGVPAGFYRHVGDRVRRAGGRFVLDSSGPALREIGTGNVFLLKANRAELGEMLGRQIGDGHALEAAAAEAVAMGYADIVVLSLGAEGALLADGHGCWWFAAVSVPVASTVGAGDSMVAGILHRLALGAPTQEAVRYGIAAGAAALMRPGTELCRLEDTDRLFEQVPPPLRR